MILATYAQYQDDVVEVLDIDTVEIHGESLTSYKIKVFQDNEDDIEMWVDSTQISDLTPIMPYDLIS